VDEVFGTHRMRVARILGVLEPGGAQLSALPNCGAWQHYRSDHLPRVDVDLQPLFGAEFNAGLERGRAIATSQANSEPFVELRKQGNCAREPAAKATHSRYQPPASR
jgi:hypothetical protein